MTSRLNPQDCELFRPDDDSDTSSSSKSLPDDRHVTLVLDIHDIKKGGEKPDNSVLSKVKKLRKKKKSARNHSPTNDSSSSPSETTTTSRTDTVIEKFYDAHGSLHALAENPIDATQPVEVPVTPLPLLDLQPVLPTTIAHCQSEHAPKAPPLAPRQSQTQPQAQSEHATKVPPLGPPQGAQSEHAPKVPPPVPAQGQTQPQVQSEHAPKVPPLGPPQGQALAQAQSEHGPKVPTLCPPQCQAQLATIAEKPLPSKPTVLPEPKSPD